MPPQATASRTDGAPIIRLSGVRFRHHPKADPITVRELALAPGEHAVVTGPSGSGKSTLLYLIAGLLQPQAGEVIVAGERMSSLSATARDRHRGAHIGMVFQTFNLVPGLTALDNVLLALMFSDLPKRDHAARAHELLAHLGLTRPNALPDELSVGQQQRVAVARALACRPAVVLADEPTASLDPDMSARAIDLLQATCRDEGAALLCVTHDPAVAARFPRRLALHELDHPQQPNPARHDQAHSGAAR